MLYFYVCLLQHLVVQASHMLNIPISDPSVCVCVGWGVRYISQCKHWCGHYIPQWGLCFITLWMNENVYVWLMGVSLSVGKGRNRAIGQPRHG